MQKNFTLSVLNIIQPNNIDKNTRSIVEYFLFVYMSI